MISSKDIRSVITALLKSKFNACEVHFSTNFDAKADYFYVELAEDQSYIDKVYLDRDISISIHFVPIADGRGRINRAKLYEAQETLSDTFLCVIRINDRYLTVQDASARIVDNVLRFSFRLRFVDYVEQEPVDLMEDLSLNGSSVDLMEEEE